MATPVYFKKQEIAEKWWVVQNDSTIPASLPWCTDFSETGEGIEANAAVTALSLNEHFGYEPPKEDDKGPDASAPDLPKTADEIPPTEVPEP